MTKDQARAEVRLELIGVVHLAKLDGLTRAEFEDLARETSSELQSSTSRVPTRRKYRGGEK